MGQTPSSFLQVFPANYSACAVGVTTHSAFMRGLVPYPHLTWPWKLMNLSFIGSLVCLHPRRCHQPGPSVLCPLLSPSPDERNILNNIWSFSLHKEGLLTYLEEIQGIVWRDKLDDVNQVTEGLVMGKGLSNSVQGLGASWTQLAELYLVSSQCDLGQVTYLSGPQIPNLHHGVITAFIPRVERQSKLRKALQTMPGHSRGPVYICHYSSYFRSP